MKRLRFILYAFLATAIFTACEKTFDYDPSDIPNDFVALPAPAPGTGFQIHVPAFPVPANFEREWFMRLPIGNTEDIYVTQFQSHSRPGTHHLVAYGYQDENAPNQPQIGVMRDQNRADGRGNFRSNFNMDINFFTAQAEEFTITMPPGMAVFLEGGATMDLNSHYYNRTNETRFGEVYLNVSTVDSSQVIHTEMATDQHMLLHSITSHMHKRGRLFKVFVVGGSRNGELLLESNDFKHPPQIFLDTPLLIEPGIGLRTEVTYENETDRTITFGVTTEDEMGIAFFLYSKI
jgi:hypothetical protein